MKNLIAVGFATALAACGGGGNNPTKVVIPDSGTTVDSSTPPGCSVLTQAGCDPGQKCTWVLSTDNDPATGTPGLGANACAPDGAKALGAACTVQKVAMGGADDCVHGTVCVSGTCKKICDNAGGMPACGMNQACVAYDGLFANSGSTTTPAGVCDPSCNPLDDNDFDGSGTAHTKTGTACGTSSTVGCYGFASKTHTTYFTCAPPAGGTGQLIHRSPVPTMSQYLNSCMSGYHLGEFYDAQGSMQIDCFAYCKPADSDMTAPGNGTTGPNGASPHRCSAVDAVGNFNGGTPNGMANSNGEHCWYSWYFEIDTANAWHKSPTSDTVGMCIDHTKYKYASTSGGMPDTVFPPCASLPTLSTMTVNGADSFGCISSTKAGLTPAFDGKGAAKRIMDARLRAGIMLPEFPDLKMSPR